MATVYPYERWKKGAALSAAEVGPHVLELLRPASVVDLGCGTGEWLAYFHTQGATEIQGIDGDWVNRQLLQIPEDRFLVRDLRQPVRLGRTFDLVMSLEVAEHLPAESAPVFVESLTNLGPIVLFSAAIPFQGGDAHINEQWPDYWRDLFAQRGYVAVDCLRRRLWQSQDMPVWYRQNLFLYVQHDVLAQHPKLREAHDATAHQQLSIVHPLLYEAKARLAERPDPRTLELTDVLGALPAITVRSLKRRAKKLLGRA